MCVCILFMFVCLCISCVCVSRALYDKGFLLQERGEIEVKGKGKMTTYFLEKNLRVSELQLLGLAEPEERSGRQSGRHSALSTTDGEGAHHHPGVPGMCVCLSSYLSLFACLPV